MSTSTRMWANYDVSTCRPTNSTKPPLSLVLCSVLSCSRPVSRSSVFRSSFLHLFAPRFLLCLARGVLFRVPRDCVRGAVWHAGVEENKRTLSLRMCRTLRAAHRIVQHAPVEVDGSSLIAS